MLVSGDVISNMHLQPVIDAHMARRKTDTNCIVTMVFKPTTATHPTQQLDDDVVVTYDEETLELVGYDNNPAAAYATLATNLLNGRAACTVRCDLLDCNIDVCSPEMLMHFADNYDYQNIRRDYIHNEVQSKEIGWKFSAYFTHEFAARIQDVRTYDSVASAIVQRWTYPIVPDSNFTGKTTFTLSRGAVYKEDDAKASMGALGDATLIGAGSSLGAGTKLVRSTVGRGSVIGANCEITGSYVWDNVTIGDGVTIDRAIVGTGVHIAAGTVVPRGVVLSFNCVVGRGAALPPFARYTIEAPELETSGFTEDEDDVADAAADADAADVGPHASLGEGGRGRLWGADEWDLEGSEWYPIDDDDESGGARLANRIKACSMGADELEAKKRTRWAEWPSDEGGADGEEGEEDGEEMVYTKFEDTVRDMVRSCIDKGATHDNIVLEVGRWVFLLSFFLSFYFHSLLSVSSFSICAARSPQLVSALHASSAAALSLRAHRGNAEHSLSLPRHALLPSFLP